MQHKATTLPLARTVAMALLLVLGSLAFSACSTVPIHKQARVSQHGMIFTDNPALGDRINLISQLEPGSAVSGGGQAAGCTACR